MVYLQSSLPAQLFCDPVKFCIPIGPMEMNIKCKCSVVWGIRAQEPGSQVWILYQQNQQHNFSLKQNIFFFKLGENSAYKSS